MRVADERAEPAAGARAAAVPGAAARAGLAAGRPRPRAGTTPPHRTATGWLQA